MRSHRTLKSGFRLSLVAALAAFVTLAVMQVADARGGGGGRGFSGGGLGGRSFSAPRSTSMRTMGTRSTSFRNGGRSMRSSTRGIRGNHIARSHKASGVRRASNRVGSHRVAGRRMKGIKSTNQKVANTNSNSPANGSGNRTPGGDGKIGSSRNPGSSGNTNTGNTNTGNGRYPGNDGKVSNPGRTPGSNGDGKPPRGSGEGYPPGQTGEGPKPGGGDGRPPRGPRGPFPGGIDVGGGGYDPGGPVGPVGPVTGGGGPTGPSGGGRGPTAATGGTALSSLGSTSASPPTQGPRAGGINLPPPNENRFVSNEVVVEFTNAMSPQALAAFTARHRLVQIEAIRLTLTNTLFLRARISDGRPVRVVLGSMSNDPALLAGTMLSAQPQYLFRTSQSEPQPQNLPAFTPPAPATPPATPVVASIGALPSAMHAAQYMLAKLHLPEAHQLSRGNDVLVAVIDSGIDASHPELAGVIVGSYDALSVREKPHFHGTAIAGAIAAHSQLEGVAPAARILAIRAFGAVGSSAEATTTAILKSIEYAMSRHARVINMSFAGPSDPGMANALSRAHAAGIVLVAASGNYGPNSPPQYPAADPNVIAVSATDANDGLFAASNRGSHIAVAAPGVDILLPSPDAGYQMQSGTSFAAAHVTGIVALLLARKPGLTPDAVRQILIATAKDLGDPGVDPLFGAGLADAYRAILAVDTPMIAAPPVPPAGGPSTAAR